MDSVCHTRSTINNNSLSSMIKIRYSLSWLGIAAALLFQLLLSDVRGQGTAFTYQGVLADTGSPANGIYDLEFRVFEAAAGGTQVGTTIVMDNLPVTNGLFTTILDFGPNVFTGPARWLNVAVRPGAAEGSFVDVLPRQPVVASPYASFAGGVNASGVIGTVPDAKLSPNVALRGGGNRFSGDQSFDGGKVGIGTGTTIPAAALHINPQSDPNSAFVIGANPISGGYTALGIGLSSLKGGYGWIQGVQLSGTAWGDVILNPNAGNVGIGKTNPVTKLDIAGEATMTACNITSDRNAKEEFKRIDAQAVLDKVAHLPITEWRYKTQTDARHIGPMAQDFREAFGLGRDDKHITSVDADGVALAAIQGLNQKLESTLAEKNLELEAVRNQITELRDLVDRLTDGRSATQRVPRQ